MDNTRQRQAEQRTVWLNGTLAVIVLAAAAVCTWRGPVRALGNPSDFILIYGPTRAWITGGNPYDMAAVDTAWLAASGPPEAAPTKRIAPNLLYPPTTLLTLAPFAVLHWPLAHWAWIAANVAFLGASLWCIARLAGFSRRQRRTWVFIALGLLLAPVHTALHHGQTPLYVMALMLPAFLIPSARATRAGVLLGLASAIKPQIGLPAIALEAVAERWRSVVAATAVIVLACVASAGIMTLQGIPWLSSWRANIVAHRTSGAGDLSAANPDRHQLVNLQYPVTALTESKSVAEISTLAVCALLAAAFFLPPRVRLAQSPKLLALSMVAVLTLMVAYHRFYDAVLLLLPLAWAIDAVAQRAHSKARAHRIAGWGVLALMTPFMLNSATALIWLRNAGRLPEWFVRSWSFEHLLLPHQGWALAAMAMCLLLAQRRNGPSGPGFDGR